MFGERFIPLSDAYDLELRRVAHLAWQEMAKDRTKPMEMHEGVYAYVGGPKFVQHFPEREDLLISSAMKPEQSVVCSLSLELM